MSFGKNTNSVIKMYKPLAKNYYHSRILLELQSQLFKINQIIIKVLSIGRFDGKTGQSTQKLF